MHDIENERNLKMAIAAGHRSAARHHAENHSLTKPDTKPIRRVFSVAVNDARLAEYIDHQANCHRGGVSGYVRALVEADRRTKQNHTP